MKISELINDKDLAKLDTIQRWSMNQVIKNENVTQHSFWVAFYASCLSEELFPGDGLENTSIKLEIVRYALMHDLDEIFTGDIGHTVKNNPINGDKLKEVLNEYISGCILSKFNGKDKFNKMLIFTLATDNITKNIIKICDWMSFIKYLDLELSLGNQSIINVRDYCIDNLKLQVEKTKLLLTNNKEVLDQLVKYV